MEKQVKTKKELQYEIAINNKLHTSVQSIERLKSWHYEVYIRYFKDKDSGFVYNKLNANGSRTWKWFSNGKDAADYMNGYTLEQIYKKK